MKQFLLENSFSRLEILGLGFATIIVLNYSLSVGILFMTAVIFANMKLKNLFKIS